MKNCGLLVLLGLFLSLLATVQSQCTEDIYEPNDNIVAATPNRNNGTFAICSVSLTAGDWFGPYFVLVGQNVTVRIDFNGSEGNLDLVLTTFDTTTIASSQSTTRPSELVTVVGQTGMTEFWAHVFLRTDAGNPGITYTYSVTFGPSVRCSDDPYEPNNNPSQATPSGITGVVCSGDPDYFGPIDLLTGETLSATLTYIDTQDQLRMTVNSASNQVLQTATNVTGSSVLNYVSVSDQTVYLVANYLSSATGNPGSVYVMEWSITQPVCNDNDYFEPNSIAELAGNLVGAAVNLVVCQDSPDFFGPVALSQGSGVSVQIMFGSADRLDIRVRNKSSGLVLTPSSHNASSTQAQVSFVNSNPSTVDVVVEIFVLSNPSGTGAVYTLFSSINLSCTGIQCPTGEVCQSGACVCLNNAPRDGNGSCPVVDACAGVSCPTGEFCSNGACVCINGTRDSTGRCVTDPCLNVVCPTNEQCVQGQCQCRPGLVRNSSGQCVEACQVVTCGQNQFCSNGTCFCNTGYVNTSNGCQPVSACSGVNCPPNSSCRDGVCYCNAGYESSTGGSSVPTSGSCRSIDCYNITCPQFSTCSSNQCSCNTGYYNPQTGTAQVPSGGTCVQDKCSSVVCPPNSSCRDGGCFCNQGYILDPSGSCVVDPCRSIVCSDPLATCSNGVCVCPAGYEKQGDNCVQLPPDACFPTSCASIGALCNQTTGTCYCDANFVISPTTGQCDYPRNDHCDFVSCPQNSACYQGLCYCNEGYMEYAGGCRPATLGGCSGYRGFTDEVTVGMMSQASLEQLSDDLLDLEIDLEYVLDHLPEWEQNECCSTKPYEYPLDMVEYAESAWAFLVDPECSLDRYNQASQQYYQDVKY